MSDTKTTTLFSLATFKQWCDIKSTVTQSISSLTSVGLTATAVCTGHGYSTGSFVDIAGAAQSGYNLATVVTVVNANTFTYPLAATQTSPATGTPTATLDDARYIQIADAASEEMEAQLGRIIVTRAVTVTFSGNGKSTQALPCGRPIVSITSFTIDGASVSSSTYVLNSRTGVLYFTDGTTFTTTTPMNCVLVAQVGYGAQDSTALPRDVYRAGLDLAKAIKDELVSNAITASSISLGPSSMTIKPSKFPPSVQRVLNSGWEEVAIYE